MKRGDVRGASFLFSVRGGDGEIWRERKNHVAERELLDLDLYEVTATAVPAYKKTSVSVRARRPKKSTTHVMNAKARMLARLREAQRAPPKVINSNAAALKAWLLKRLNKAQRAAPCSIGFKRSSRHPT